MPSIRIRAISRGDRTEVQALIQHPMDSGYVKDSSGKTIPPHFIEVVRFEAAGKEMLHALWGPAISKNPYIKFFFKGGKTGDPVKVSWKDNLGKEDSLETKIQ